MSYKNIDFPIRSGVWCVGYKESLVKSSRTGGVSVESVSSGSCVKASRAEFWWERGASLSSPRRRRHRVYRAGNSRDDATIRH